MNIEIGSITRPNIEIGPTGALIQGSIHDCNKSSLESAIKSYDPLLYIKWNPNKFNKMGCWELRRRPEKKSVKQTLEYGGAKYHHLDYVEIDIVNHIFDVPVLGYNLVQKIKKSDVWAAAGYDGTNLDKIYSKLTGIEDKRLEIQQGIKDKNMSDALYGMKQIRNQLNGYRQSILDGQNPADLVRYMPK